MVFVTESQNECMNLVISGVISTAPGFQGNDSDDDVIEVINDDAPIEILSDDEDMDLKQKESQSHNSPIQNFHFTSVSTAENSTDENRSGVLEDPLKEDSLKMIHSSNTFETLSAIPCSVIALPPPSDKTKSIEVNQNSTDSKSENSPLNDVDDTTLNEVPCSVIALPPSSDKPKSTEVNQISTGSMNKKSPLNDIGDTKITKEITNSEPMEDIEKVLNENGTNETDPNNSVKVGEDHTVTTSADKTE